MPEGPEVSVIVNKLSKLLIGATLNKMTYTHKKVFAKISSLPYNLPKVVKKVRKKGKYFWIEFEDETCVGNSFGLTGKFETFVDQENKENKVKHACGTFEFTKGDQSITMHYVDRLAFGKFEYFTNKSALFQKIGSIGMDVLHMEQEDYDEIFEKTIHKTPWKTLCKFLMDQSKFSGIGNYLKAEILFHAKLSPNRQIQNLTSFEIASLFESIKHIYAASIEAGGSPKYGGAFELQIYDRKDLVDTGVVCEKTDDGRKTWWNPTLQI